MRRISSVYLSGPERWAPGAEALIARQHALCEAAGVQPLSATPTALETQESSEIVARELYTEALASLRQADALIANLTPWRGPSGHPAVTFEAGFAAALGKPVFAYMNLREEGEAEYVARVDGLLGVSVDEHGVIRDPEDTVVEDFGLPETAMLWAEARRFFCVVTVDPWDDVTGVELCLEAMKAYAD